MMLNLPKLIGHRGVKNLSPENTIDSIYLAKKLGLNWVEVDVKISQDLVPFLQSLVTPPTPKEPPQPFLTKVVPM